MGLADLHLHTTHSDGLVTPEKLIERFHEEGKFNVIAVTDHDLIGGAFKAREHAKKCGLKMEVLIGTEISTRHGHIVALGVEKLIPKFKSAEETIQMIHAQGGLAIAAHPLNFLTASLHKKKNKKIFNSKKNGIYFDAMEIASVYPFFNLVEKKVLNLSKELGISELGASDGHFEWEQGKAYTEFEGENIQDLLHAIKNKKTKAIKEDVPLSKYLNLQVPFQMFRSWTWKNPFSPFNPKI
jgi:predicted metal-dependent phosphoesterase TrpH